MSIDVPSGEPKSARQQFTYRDSSGVEVTAYRWQPHQPPLAAVQISHGIGEHALRYERFAQALVHAGFCVYADDHRGHGATGLQQWGGNHSKLGQLGTGGLRATEAAILSLTALIREQHPNVPVFMFAHSWGSLMAQRIMNTASHAWDAVVLSGSAFRTPVHLESKPLNSRWNAPDASGFEWLSRDPRTAQQFLADPLCFNANILKLFGLRDTLRLFGRPSAQVSAETPVLIISGTDDPLNRGSGLEKLAAAYRKRGVRDVTLRLYTGARHELLNETNQNEVIADVITWMVDRADFSERGEPDAESE